MNTKEEQGPQQQQICQCHEDPRKGMLYQGAPAQSPIDQAELP